ncbi:MAG: radical SAM protein [Candidatus Hodarchaeota archaeon]
MKKLLLVEPNFPYPSKSKNQANKIHRNFVPIGLLKIGSFYKSSGHKVRLVRGNQGKDKFRHFEPSLILVTSIFTYWSKYVWNTIEHYRVLFPKAQIILGGIYATLHHNKKYFQENLKCYNVRCYVGLHSEAERFYPDYSLLGGDVDHHATHTMRGCIRKCSFCGVWKIEPKKLYKTSEELIKEIKSIGKNKVIFFDNNFLANSNIRQILSELVDLKVNSKPVTFECQSGLDGRLLERNPELAVLLKKAHFHNVRIAWDNSLSDFQSIKKQLNHLTAAGYNPKDISVFMLYNYDIPYEKMLKKVDYCKKWGVQIADCRYRPLDSVKDDYDPSKYRYGQTKDEYYIHKRGGWTDQRVRDFRRKVRQHNIWIRYAKDKGLPYDKRMEKWSSIHNTFKFFNMGRPPQLEFLEKSSTWKRRLQMMYRVKNYYKKHDLNTLDFSSFTNKRIDEELTDILAKIEPPLFNVK